jgi:hypothetical protein
MKTPRLPCGKAAAVGATGVASKPGGQNITECLEPRNQCRSEVAERNLAGRPTRYSAGKADVVEGSMHLYQSTPGDHLEKLIKLGLLKLHNECSVRLMGSNTSMEQQQNVTLQRRSVSTRLPPE